MNSRPIMDRVEARLRGEPYRRPERPAEVPKTEPPRPIWLDRLTAKGTASPSVSLRIDRRPTMRSIKRLLAVMGTIVALMALAPGASAGSHKDFHLDKTCGPDASEPLKFV